MRFRFVAYVLVALTISSSPVRAADPVTVVDLAVHSAQLDQPRSPADVAVALAARAGALDAIEAAVDPETGGLALVVPRQGTVVLFPKFVASAGKRAEPIVAKVGGFPAGIAYKKFGDKAYFVVACHLGKELVLLDPVTLKREKSIPVILGRPTSIVTSYSSRDPFVYYTTVIGEPPRSFSGFGWVNLTTGKDESSPSGLGGGLVPSADGTRLYVSHFQTVSVFDAPDPAAPGKTSSAKRLLAPVDACWIGDPRGEYLAGTRVWSLREEKVVAQLPVPVRFASPTVPAMFGFDLQTNRLSAVSTNSLKVVGFVGLKREPHENRWNKEVEARERDRVSTAVPGFQVLEDPTTKTILLVFGRTVRIVPFSALGVTDEPPLNVADGGPLEFPVGGRHAVKVSPTAAGVSVELASGPEGMTYEAGALTWTAGESAVGFHPVELKLSAKGATRTVPLSVRARRPSLALPFADSYNSSGNAGLASRLPLHHRYLSPDGSAAVFMGFESLEGKNPPMNRIAVVNLDKLAVEGERKLLVGATTAAIDERNVYVALAESDAVKVLDRKDLSDRELIYTTGRPADLARAGDLLLTSAWNGNRRDYYRVEAFDATSLKPKPFDVIAVKQPTREVSGGTTVPPVPVGGGWWYDGVVFDAKFDKVRAVLDPRAFWIWHAKAKALSPGPPFDPPLEQGVLGRGRWYTAWGVSLTNAQLLVNGERVGYIPASAAPPAPEHPNYIPLVLSDRPAVACLMSSRVMGREKRPVIRTEVTFYNLSAEPGPTVVLTERPADLDPHAPPERTGLRLTPLPNGRLMAVVDRELFVFPVPTLDPDKFPPPLHFTPDFPVTTVSADEVSVALPAPAGGKGPISFKLTEDVPGIRLDEQNKKLVIAPRELVPALTEQIVAMVRKGQGEPTLKTYLEVIGPRFERLTGKKPAGVPVWVPVSIRARDKLLGESTGRFGFFVDVPLDGVKAKLGGKQ